MKKDNVNFNILLYFEHNLINLNTSENLQM